MADRFQRQRAPHQLPTGRHGLSRQYVMSNQRNRILRGAIVAVATRGYPATRVQDITTTAGVSRRTFYELFRDRETAFLTAYDRLVERLHEQVIEAFASEGTWPAAVCSGLTRLLQTLTAEPQAAHACLVEVLAAGPAGLDRRRRAMAAFSDLLRAPPGDVVGGRLPHLVPETASGGIYEVIHSRVSQGRASELEALAPDLVWAVLMPVTGSTVADEQAKRAQELIGAVGVG